MSECKLDRTFLRLAAEIETEEQASVVFETLVAEFMKSGESRAEAELTVRTNIGYLGGYVDHETRARIERLFKVEHPFFGSIEKNGPPTPEQAFALGMAWGELMRRRSDGIPND